MFQITRDNQSLTDNVNTGLIEQMVKKWNENNDQKFQK
jgi:hypothetical protein